MEMQSAWLNMDKEEKAGVLDRIDGAPQIGCEGKKPVRFSDNLCAVRMELSSRTRQCLWLQKQQKEEGEWKKVEVPITEDCRRQIGHVYIGIQVNFSHLRASNKHS